jgi:FtsP/CotA-like multicopper oxidase with cupredoxin domain
MDAPPESDGTTRREFLSRGTAAATVVLLAGGSTVAHEIASAHEAEQKPPAGTADRSQKAVRRETNAADKFGEFSRFQPSFGGPPESDDFLGKLVPGRRDSGLAPVPFHAPDVESLPWKMVDGRKEFHLRCEHVQRELLPGKWFDFFGYNGSIPGPTIEAFQGDKVRFVVHNALPEPTTVHWHGFELPVGEDGVPGLVQDPIKPGKSYVYEFDLHQVGTFFYHSHMPMQEAFGMVGFFIIHPQVAWNPPVDRDFGLLFQNFRIDPNQTIPDSMAMDWNWHTINGRSGPYTTPLVVRHGERVRIRILDFSPQQHHPIHLHGHTFWITGHEGTRIPSSAWIPRNTELIGVAQASDLEFIAFNPGDWLLHCHMVHHMMNHMVRQVGPRIRHDVNLDDYRRIESRPQVPLIHRETAFEVPGYPQMMQGHGFSDAELEKINGRRETRGMRMMWHMAVKGLMTVVRVLPDDLFHLVMQGDQPVKPGQVFDEVMRRSQEKPESP